MTAALPSPAVSRLTVWRSAVSRLLGLELRHNAMAGLAPVVIGLFWLITYRKMMALPPLWDARAAAFQTGAVADFIVPVTGAAVWMGSREARRRIGDQVAITARPRWTRLLITWAATATWTVAAYLVCLAAGYAVTAHQANWGGPLWWPAGVSAVSVVMFSALGFVVGAFAPGRFTAPFAAIAAFFILAFSTEPITGTHSYWQVSPIVSGPWDLGAQTGVATFYPFLPDLSIAQVMFLGGLILALLGVLGLPAGSGGRASRLTAACLAGAGLLAAGTAVKLVGTGTLDPHGMIAIPALHDAASDRPLQYIPVCSRTPIPVCLNPAYATYLPATAAALTPVLGQLAGLPGAPARIGQAPVTYQQDAGNDVAIAGRSPAFQIVLPAQLTGPSTTPAQQAAQVATGYGPALVGNVIGDQSPAQDAVAAGLLTAAGLRDQAAGPGDQATRPGDQAARPGDQAARPGGLDAGWPPDVTPGTPAYAAAQRFAALPAAARHAWLVRHLTALRAGQITLAQLP
jgi:hypothetical protein